MNGRTNAAGSGKAKGIYLWEKYDSYTPPRTETVSFSWLGMSDGYCQVKLTLSAGLSFDDVTGKMLLDHRFMYAEIESNKFYLEFYNETTLEITRSGDEKWVSYTLDKSTGIMKFKYTYGSNIDIAETKTMYDLEINYPGIYGNVIDYAVGDDASAYPNAGYHTDGYYYKKIALPEKGTIIPTANTQTLAIPTNLKSVSRVIVTTPKKVKFASYPYYPYVISFLFSQNEAINDISLYSNSPYPKKSVYSIPGSAVEYNSSEDKAFSLENGIVTITAPGGSVYNFFKDVEYAYEIYE